MTENFPSWLTKQMVKGVRGFNLDAYLLALEGWRRGLTLKWYDDPSLVTDLKIIGFNPLGKTFSLRSKDSKTHFFYRSRGDKVSNEAVELGTNKNITKEILLKHGIKTPRGKGFDEKASIDDIANYGEDLGFPLVVKPTFGSLGKGVITNIVNKKDLKEAIQYIRHQLGYQEIIIEDYIVGDDLRVYVIEDRVVGAIHRKKAHIIGDGLATIEKLIKKKNSARRENPYLRSKLIKFDDELNSKLHEVGYTLQTIPKEGEEVYLKSKSNLTSGGDSIDITDTIHPKIKKLAVNAVQSLPHLNHAAVDILLESENKASVLEINTTAGISLHIFPSVGQPRNIPEKIIDYYFPETKGLAENRTKIYFDYRKISNLLQRAVIQEFQVTEAPRGKLYAKRYVISGKVQKVGYRSWVRREAKRRNLHGYTRNLRNGKVVVVVGSESKQDVDNFKEVCYSGPRRANVENIREYTWDTQIKVGFELRKMRIHKGTLQQKMEGAKVDRKK